MHKQIRNTLCIFIGLMGFAAMPAVAAVDMILCIEGVKGEGGSSKHKDCIEILAWSWGVSQSGTTHMGSGGGAGKASFQDISFTKYVDLSSPKLLQFVATGEHMTEVELFVYKAGGDCPQCNSPYIRLEAEDSIVSSISTGGSGGEEKLTENISINFAKYEYCYIPEKDGQILKANEVCHRWDIAANAPR